MQQYLALTAADLTLPTPPQRESTFVVAPRDGSDLSADEAAEAARDSAAWDSLLLARDAEATPTRIVAAGDPQDAQSGFTSWDEVSDFYVDDAAGRALCAQIFAARDQSSADALMERLSEEPLMWFDASERAELAAVLAPAETVGEV